VLSTHVLCVCCMSHSDADSCQHQSTSQQKVRLLASVCAAHLNIQHAPSSRPLPPLSTLASAGSTRLQT
jgi:hypothetical protein